MHWTESRVFDQAVNRKGSKLLGSESSAGLQGRPAVQGERQCVGTGLWASRRCARGKLPISASWEDVQPYRSLHSR